MYLWLKDGAEEKLEALKEKKLVGNLRAETDATSGKKYVCTDTEISDPTSEIATCLCELAKKVTIRERIFRGLRTEGIYHYNGVTLIVKTQRSFGRGSPDSNELCQDLSISGPTVERVRVAYSLFRQGKLQPTEAWGEPAPITPPPATALAVETKKAPA